MDQVVLRATEVTKSYAGVQALKRASLELRAGEVHALVGENGAGKSTLIKILTGAVQPDGGEITLDGEPLDGSLPRAAKALGIAAIYQQPALFPELTVAENIALGLERTGPVGTRGLARAARARRASCSRASARGSIRRPTRATSACRSSSSWRSRVRSAPMRACSSSTSRRRRCRRRTRDNLFRVVRELRAQGVGMIYISHRLEELPTIADRVTVLRDGHDDRHARRWRDVNREQLIQMMVGRELSAVFPKRTVPLGDTVLELRGVGCAAGGVRDVDAHGARGGDRRTVGARRRGTHGAGAHDLRPHAGRLAARSACADAACASARPADAIALRHRLRARGPAPARRRARDAGERERHARRARQPVALRRARLPARARARRRLHEAPRREDAVDPLARLDAVGRQPAEGGAQPLAADEADGAHPRRADAGDRRRREVGDSRADDASWPRRAWPSS